MKPATCLFSGILNRMATADHDPKIYKKKIESREGCDIWLVDGGVVRATLDENFVEYDHHAHFSFIPKGELWIDTEMPEQDRHFFIDRMCKELELMKEGLSYHDAAHQADSFEKKERQGGARVKKILAGARTEILAKIKEKKLDEWSDVVSVWLVNGTLVRDIYLVAYGEGGHDLVYPFIPKNEIWIESSLPPHERKFIVLHELHERYLMQEGSDYEHAHQGATIVEAKFRADSTDLGKRIKEEMGHFVLEKNGA